MASRTLTGSVAQIWGLPFTLASVGDLSNGGGTIAVVQNTGATFNPIYIYPQNGANYCFLIQTSGVPASSTTTVGQTFWGASTRIAGTVYYAIS